MILTYYHGCVILHCMDIPQSIFSQFVALAVRAALGASLGGGHI